MAVSDWSEEELTKQANRLRRDVGASEDVFDNAKALTYFEESEESYPNDTAKMIAHTRVIALRGIRASAAMLGKYARNQAQEDLTKVFDNLGEMLEEWKTEVATVADPIDNTEVTPFFFGTAQGYRGL